VVLDYACGEALFAARVADACAGLYLAEPAPGVRGRLIARFAPNTKIRVRSLDDLRHMAERSVDLAVMNSVAQYMTPDELDAALAVIRRLLKPGGRLVLGDILLDEAVHEALHARFNYLRVRRQTLPFKFACPSGVLRSGARNFGATEIASPWADAVAQAG